MNRLIALFLAGMGLFCWYRGAERAVALEASHPLAELYWDDPSPLYATQLTALEEEENSFALVRERRGVELFAPLRERREWRTVLEVLGDASLLLDPSLLVEGTYPQGDLLQCMVDEKTAQALWGYGEAAGQILEMDGVRYTVSGVFASPRTAVICSKAGSAFAPGYAAYLPGPGSVSITQEAADWAGRMGLPEPSRSSETGTAAALLRQAAFLPLWIPLLLAAYCCVHALFPGGGEGRAWARRLCWLLMLWGIAKALGFSLGFLGGFLPTRWSDFSFWPDHLRGMAETLSLQWTGSGALTAWIRWETGYLPIMLYEGGAFLCFAAAVAAFRPRAPRAGVPEPAVEAAPEEAAAQ